MADSSGSAWIVPALGLIVPLAVAGVAIIGAIINENYKRHYARAAVAAAIHAEISALAEITASSSAVSNWNKIAKLLEAGNNICVPKMFTPEPGHGAVYSANILNLGLLSHLEAEGVIRFNELLLAIRTLVRHLADGVWDDQPQAAAVKAIQVRTGLGYWAECEKITVWLLPALRRTASRKFRFTIEWFQPE